MFSEEFKNNIKLKIKDLGCEIGEDSLIAEFISVMIQNNKSKQHMIEELTEILGDQESIDLVQWIMENLPSATSNIPFKNRILENALNAAIKPVPTQSSAIRTSPKRSYPETSEYESSKVSKPNNTTIFSRLGPSNENIKDRLGPKPDKEFTQIIQDESKLVKCKFWPNCTKTDCPNVHPTKMCFAGEKCQKEHECTYIHPSDLVKSTALPAVSSKIICKFGLGCLRVDCTFLHPDGYKLPLSSSPSATIPCKYAADCLNPICSFSHPTRAANARFNGGLLGTFAKSSTMEDADIDIVSNVTPENDLKASTRCKFDPFCSRKGCLYQHGNKQNLPTSSKFTTSGDSSSKFRSITKTNRGGFKNRSLINKSNHISNRTFAVPDEQTENISNEKDESGMEVD